MSENVAKGTMGARLVSIDMALDTNEKWRCIELTPFGQTMKFAQDAGEPFFGKFTDEIINNL